MRVIKCRSSPPIMLTLILAFLGAYRLRAQHIFSSQMQGTRRVCNNNPFAASLSQPLDIIVENMDTWLRNETTLSSYLSSAGSSYDHQRFEAFTEMSSCDHTCVGGECSGDESKIVCGLSLLREPCIIYSIGSNNQWNFELDALSLTPCDVHTFDCTGALTRFQPPDNPRLYFHHICLVSKHSEHSDDSSMQGGKMSLTTLQKKLGHSRLDLLKMDIEGFEWPILESWSEPDSAGPWPNALPMQILVEVHYRTQMKDLASDHLKDFKVASDMVRLSSKLNQLGYFTAVNDNNPFCPHCTELTLLKARC